MTTQCLCGSEISSSVISLYLQTGQMYWIYIYIAQALTFIILSWSFCYSHNDIILCYLHNVCSLYNASSDLNDFAGCFQLFLITISRGRLLWVIRSISRESFLPSPTNGFKVDGDAQTEFKRENVKNQHVPNKEEVSQCTDFIYPGDKVHEALYPIFICVVDLKLVRSTVCHSPLTSVQPCCSERDKLMRPDCSGFGNACPRPISSQLIGRDVSQQMWNKQVSCKELSAAIGTPTNWASSREGAAGQKWKRKRIYYIFVWHFKVQVFQQ